MNDEIKDVEIRQATADDMRHFCPDGPPHSSYAWIAFYKGEPACLAGLTINRYGCCAFSDVKPGIKAPARTIFLTAKVLMEHIKALNIPMYATCDLRDKMAQKFVSRLGFKHQRTHHDLEVFTWRVS